MSGIKDKVVVITGASSGIGEATYARTDVKRREDVSNLIGLAIERYGKLDVLVNNAGVAPISLLDELRVEDWEEMIDVNLKGVLYGIAAALPVFRRQSFGHLVNVISTAGIQIIPTMATGTANTRDTFFKSWANTNPLIDGEPRL